ncbi:MAG: hypothetical protein A3F73_01250 [Gallionellales bacterium RIFCSPLOWO2_12_FULL_59_22]|nr:MAG: hypothetical protein A3H99_10180 [Gallionellales bacterium RIFCSPLOWO2_02_FULL_59_110]OGT04721.1 MAG: hypothetical protein A2Z65_10375 [Gallionellales bacterium RIFCSPLOWO2_02_58_13]OGT12939.1 MAG: hypothetical protein A3F73_01250 [Gallionellales bacterium RIFCSPLOWO2_12_FULL_59_22]
MSYYRNHPGGMGRMSENITATSRPVVIEGVLVTGNRAQKRWAKRKLQQVQRADQRQKNGGGHA